MIPSSKNRIKYLNTLKVKKYRKKHGQFIIEGEKIVAELLQSSYSISHIYALPEWFSKYALPYSASLSGIIAQEISPKTLQSISSLSTPNQVIAVVNLPEPHIDDQALQQGYTIVLDGIRDPGNLGTIIRTADWFGIRQIICSPDCVDLYNAKTLQATMASFMRVQVIYHDLPDLLAKYAQITRYAALLSGQSLYTTTFNGNGFILIGNESNGISAAVLEHVDQAITIPRKGAAESLNAAIATALICAHAVNS